MGFMYSYKCLEKICNEIYGCINGVYAYIDDMKNKPDGASVVPCWNDDLKQLKHYNWIRNQISHNPDCDEFNMSDYEDEKWLIDFRKRILSGEDPITLYRKAKEQTKNLGVRNTYTPKMVVYNNYDENSHINNPSSKSSRSFLIVGIAVVILVLSLIYYFLYS